MIGYRIKIITSKLDSYWYADYIDKEYWAYLDDDQKNYVIIQEGIIYREQPDRNPNFGDKVVISEDCEVVGSSHILVDIVTTQKIIDVFVKDLRVDRKPMY